MANFIPKLVWNTSNTFTFKYPSTKQAEPQYLPTEQISESVGGSRQVQINNILKKITVEFEFLTKTEIDNLKTNFYLAWAVYGKTFSYYESSDVSSFEDYELDNLDWKPVRQFPSEGDFKYKIELKFRRVYL